jgi:cell fate (sporulation/competence/biofilm development) regulator YlbF (YheA/YmcA/DUF963 family)
MEVRVGQEAVVDNNIIINTKMATVSSELLETVSNLADNITQSEPFLRYKETQLKLKSEPGMVQLLEDFSQLQQKIRAQQFSSGISQTEINWLHRLQSEITQKETFQENESARLNAVAFLREVNQEISNLLGIDFASLTRKSGGC